MLRQSDLFSKEEKIKIQGEYFFTVLLNCHARQIGRLGVNIQQFIISRLLKSRKITIYPAIFPGLQLLKTRPVPTWTNSHIYYASLSLLTLIHISKAENEIFVSLRPLKSGINFQLESQITISLLTLVTMVLLWWYAELERRLLVLRRKVFLAFFFIFFKFSSMLNSYSHLSEGVYLFQTPLALHFYMELVMCMLHLPS